jgi:uncharacterized membrane protein YkvA (DUF1232 family)
MWRDLVIGLATAVIVAWLVLILALLTVRPRGSLLSEGLRILPDLIRLWTRLATDSTLPRGVRVRIALLTGYLALPIDLIPDFVPVLGHADDAIVVAAVLRSFVRRVGAAPLQSRWPGTNDSFAAKCRLTGIAPPTEQSGDS